VSPAVAAIFRYPIKGLAGEELRVARLMPGEALPGDRRFAIARGDAGIDPDRPEWRPKRSFVMLMHDAELARLRASVDEERGTITFESDGRPPFAADARSAEGREALEAYLNDALGARPEGPARFVEARGFSFADRRDQGLSVIGLESLADLESRAGRSVDPRRFRANLLVRGAAPFAEFEWVGARLHAGEAVLRVLKRLGRCPATEVDPDTGARDLDVVGALERHFGHTQIGVLAEVVRGGNIAVGDVVRVEA